MAGVARRGAAWYGLARHGRQDNERRSGFEALLYGQAGPMVTLGYTSAADGGNSMYGIHPSAAESFSTFC